MLVYARRSLLLFVVAALAACSGTGGTGTSPALSDTGPAVNAPQVVAAALDSAPEVNGGREII